MNINNKIFTLVMSIVLTGFSLTISAQESGSSSYKTGIGIRGGLTSGLTIKHFISSNAALEGIIGSRWRGLNIAGIYELHKRNALGVSRLSWEYGLGGRVGFYDGKYYREWDNKYYDQNRSYTTVSIIGMLGLEYFFNEIPFTVGLDIMPYFGFIGRGNSFIDGSVSFRYVF
jgi:hypothetical protein